MNGSRRDTSSKPLSAQVLDGGNISVVLSTLIFSPVPDDHGKILKCRGENPELPDAYLEDFFQLNVVCECRSREHVDGLADVNHNSRPA